MSRSRDSRAAPFTAVVVALALALATVSPAGAGVAAHSRLREFATPAPAATPNVADQRFDALAARYVETTWELDPVKASLAGLHAGDDRLGAYDVAGYERRIAFTKRTLRELITIDFGDLSPDEDDDAEILRAHLELQLLSLDERETWRHDPTLFLRLADTAAQSLLDRPYAPAPERLRALLARELAIPGMLRDAMHDLTDVDPETIELSREALGRSVAYFSGPVLDASAGIGDAALQSELENADAGVVASLRAFSIALEEGPFAHPAGTAALGPERFARMLALSEIDPELTPAEFERTAVGALERSRSQFVKTAARIDPRHDAPAVAQALDASHPPASGVLAAGSADLTALTSFVQSHHLVTLPPLDVRIVRAPPYERGGPIASLDVPGPFERPPYVDYLDVDVPDAVSPATLASRLGLFNDEALPLVGAHEVMPGHAVAAELARREHLSLVRRVFPNRGFVEGWAFYAEQMIVEEGFDDRDPRIRLAQLQLELERECRALVALRLHTQGMTIADATHFFVENAYLPDDAARREALHAMHDPMEGDYLIGKLALLKLRDDYRNKLGPRFTLLAFHDAVLAHGAPPIAILRRRLLGSDDDGRLFY